MVSEKVLILHKELYDVRWHGTEGDFHQLEKEFLDFAESESMDLEEINKMVEQIYIPPYQEHLLPKHLTVKSVGRPSLGVTKKVSITLPENVWTYLEAKKRKQGVSRSQVLREIIEEYFGEGDKEGS